MTTPKLYHLLYKAISEGHTETVFKRLAKVECPEERAFITSLIFDDNTTYRVARQTLRPVKLEGVVRRFCKNLESKQEPVFLSYSCKGYTHPLEASLSVTSPHYAEIKGRLHCALTHLYALARIRKATFMLVGLSSTKNRLCVSLDTDASLLHSIHHHEDLAFSMALNHIRQMGGKLSAKCIGLSLELFRITISINLTGSAAGPVGKTSIPEW